MNTICKFGALFGVLAIFEFMEVGAVHIRSTNPAANLNKGETGPLLSPGETGSGDENTPATAGSGGQKPDSEWDPDRNRKRPVPPAAPAPWWATSFGKMTMALASVPGIIGLDSMVGHSKAVGILAGAASLGYLFLRALPFGNKRRAPDSGDETPGSGWKPVPKRDGSGRIK